MAYILLYLYHFMLHGFLMLSILASKMLCKIVTTLCFSILYHELYCIVSKLVELMGRYYEILVLTSFDNILQ